MKSSLSIAMLSACLLLVGISTSLAQVETTFYELGVASQQGVLFPDSHIPIEQVDPGNLDELIQKDEAADEKGKPYRFAKALPINITTENSGVWKQIKGKNIWQMSMSSPKALSLSLIFSDLNLNPQAELYIYSIDQTIVYGPITSQQNTKKYFATDVLETSQLIIELHEPISSNTFKSSLRISKIAHGYRELLTDEVGTSQNISLDTIPNDSTQIKSSRINRNLPDQPTTNAYGDSDACNLDVYSTQANGWQRQSDAVALVIYDDNTRTCSGCLLNNTRQDRRPFFLTAFHCFNINASAGATLEAGEINLVQTAIFRFHFKRHYANGSSLRTTLTYSNSTFRAGWRNTDFVLTEITGTNFNRVSFLGWDSQNAVVPTGGAFLHHPRGDVMKFSLSHDPPQLNVNQLPVSGYPAAPANTVWVQDFISHGGLQPGSSGCPIMKGGNQGQFVYGQLFAAGPITQPCGLTTIACGALHISWNGNGTNNTRLSNWLAPDDLQRRTLGMLCSPPPQPVITQNFQCQSTCYMNLRFGNTENAFEYDIETTTPGGSASTFTKRQDYHAVYAETPGNYRVRVRARNFCGTTTWSTINFYSPGSSFSSVNVSSTEFSVYPNPAQHEISIKVFNQEASENSLFAEGIIDHIELYDKSGELVLNTSGSDKHTQISIATIPNGTYIMHIFYGTGVIHKHIFIDN